MESDAAAESSEDFTAPDTLQASLMSRLDRLGNAKDIAQIGSDFPYLPTAQICSRSSSGLKNQLESLV